MMKQRHYYCGFVLLLLVLLVNSCRNEELVNSYQNSNREEEFFEAEFSKMDADQMRVYSYLKSENEKNHFVLKISDQEGAPVWERMKRFSSFSSQQQYKSGDPEEIYSIPLKTDGIITSVLYCGIKDEQITNLRDITNYNLWYIINDETVDKKDREFVLLNCLLYDSETFGTDMFINIPVGLLGVKHGHPNNVRTLRNYGGTSLLTTDCITLISNCTCLPGKECDGCNDDGQCVVVTLCFSSSGGSPWGGDGGDGGNSGNGGDGGNGGNPPETSPCGGANKPFYKSVPCDDDGGDGGDTPLYDSPCDKIKKIGKNSKTKELFQNLKTKTSSTKEYGYVLTEDSDVINETAVEGDVGAAGINFSVSGEIDGVIHSHYTGLLSVFSVSDMFGLAQMYKKGHIKDMDTFVIGVVTASNTQYLMVIDDPMQFSTFADNLFTGGVIDEIALKNYEFLYQELYKIKPTNTSSANENAFVGYLQTARTGLKLIKGNSTFKNWGVLSIDSDGTVSQKNCP